MNRFGVLNLNKPPGMTSRQAVDRVKRIVRPAKIGHAGTLDPIATGVLLICIGPATRLTEHVHRLSKSYRAKFLLGQSSPTDDIEVEAEHHPDLPQPLLAEIENNLPHFTGEIMQRPPAFSAVKVKGERAYKLARKGDTLELAAKPISIYGISVVSYQFPELILDIDCSTGTYVRSLGRDLAESLGTRCVMSALVRKSIGPFRIDTALDPVNLDEKTLSENLLPAQSLLSGIKTLELTEQEFVEISHGRPIAIRNNISDATEIAALDTKQMLIAILKKKPEGLLWPVKTFLNT